MRSIRARRTIFMKITLETGRLILRPWSIDDAEAMFYGWANDPEVTKYLTWNPHQSIDETKAFLSLWIEQYKKPERFNFAIVLKETGELIGGIDVVGYLDGPEGTPVIGYCSSKKHWNHGYMTEACKCLLNFLFEEGYKEVRIDADVGNIGSNRVIQKCGGVFEFEETQEVPLKNKTVQINSYLVKNNL